jgi:hypothetical protein
MTAAEKNRIGSLLLGALRQHSAAESEAESEQALLSLHEALRQALCDYLENQGHDQVYCRNASFPELIDLVRGQTDLFGSDDRIPNGLRRINSTRNRVAHPGEGKPTHQQVASDTRQLDGFIHELWYGLFDEYCPDVSDASKQVPRPPSPRQVSPPRTYGVPASPPTVEPEPYCRVAPERRSPSELGRFFLRLWKDDSGVPFRKMLFIWRLVCIFVLLTLSRWLNGGAVITARWPEPVKYIGVLLFLMAVACFIFWGVIIWKVLVQIRLRGLLILLGIGYLLLLTTSILTSESSLPIHQEAWMATRELVFSGADGLYSTFRAVVMAPGEFRFAYTGHRRPVAMPGIDSEDTAYLTPVPANYSGGVPPATQSQPSPTGATALPGESVPTSLPATATADSALLPPDCPHSQARLTAPKVNQVVRGQVQVEGAANIEDFDYYKFEVRSDVEDEWHWIASFETPVEQGVLGTWDVSGLPEGTYIFRLLVVNHLGNYPFPPCEVRVQVRH